MSNLSTYLPPTPGLLPYWYFFTAAAGMYNSIQNLMVTWQTKEIYSNKDSEVTPLACRLAATWTGLTAMVRVLAAYHLNDPTVYKMGQSTFLIALLHFGSELFIFRSIKLNRASISPMIIARANERKDEKEEEWAADRVWTTWGAKGRPGWR